MNTLDELLQTHKQCSKCKAYLLFDSFSPNLKTISKLQAYCKVCANESAKESFKKRYAIEPLREKLKQKSRNEYEENVKTDGWSEKRKSKPKKKISSEEYKRRSELSRSGDQQKIRARRIINNNISSGKLIRQPCEVCGDPKSEAHHEDYNKPLDVIWLCLDHHRELHRKHNYK